MTAVAAGAGRALVTPARLGRTLLGVVVVAIAATAIAVAGMRTEPGTLDALLLGATLVPVVVCLVTALMITFAGVPTAFRGYLAVSMMLFVGSAAIGDLGSATPGIAPWVSHLVTVIAVFGFLPVGYLFPTGRPVPGWSRWLLLGWLAAGTVALAFPWDPFPGPALLVLTGLVLPLIGSIVACQIWRYRRVSAVAERQQAKWLLVALSLIAIRMLVVVLMPQGTVADGGPAGTVLAVSGPIAITALPAAIGFAMLRYRLFDVDLVIGRALVYAAVSGFVLAAYLVIVGAVGLAWPAGVPVLLPVAATAVAGVGLAPVHRWTRRLVNRWLYGDRDDPATVLGRLADDLTQTSQLTDTLERLAGTLVAALRLGAVEVVAEDSDGTPLGSARAGSDASAEPSEVPLLFEGRRVGLLRAHPRPGERLRRPEAELLQRVASSAGIAVHAALTTVRLQRSRAALVTAREYERARLHRELHDGVGPTLASVTQRLDRASQLVGSDPERAAAILASAQDGTERAIAELRAAVAGLRPPALEQLGLIEALRTTWTGAAGAPVEIGGDPGPLPAAVETAAYRIAMEAIGNAVRHSHGTWCRVSLATSDNTLRLRIEDDGVGGVTRSATGSGLITMRERAEELGGSLRVSDRHPGTRVEASIPLGGLA